MKKRFFYLDQPIEFECKIINGKVTLKREEFYKLYILMTLILQDEMDFIPFKRKEKTEDLNQSEIEAKSNNHSNIFNVTTSEPVASSSVQIESKPEKIQLNSTTQVQPQNKKSTFSQEQIQKMKTLKAKLNITDNNQLNPYISDWSLGHKTSWRELTPENIDDFINYLSKI